MAEFSCAAAGADSCGWKTTGGTEDEILTEVADHLRTKHDVQHVSTTLARYALAVTHGDARPAEPRPSESGPPTRLTGRARARRGR